MLLRHKAGVVGQRARFLPVRVFADRRFYGDVLNGVS
jgi:hypothetical protein